MLARRFTRAPLLRVLLFSPSLSLLPPASLFFPGRFTRFLSVWRFQLTLSEREKERKREGQSWRGGEGQGEREREKRETKIETVRHWTNDGLDSIIDLLLTRSKV